MPLRASEPTSQGSFRLSASSAGRSTFLSVRIVALRESVRGLRCQKPGEVGSAHIGPVRLQLAYAIPVAGAGACSEARESASARKDAVVVGDAPLYVGRVTAAIATFKLWTHSANATRHIMSARNESPRDP